MTNPRIEAAARALYENTVGLEWPRDADDEARADYYEDARIALAAADAAAWIKISDRLPGDGQEVLISTRDGIIINDKFNLDDEGGYFDCADAEDVTHWRPLPAPPTGGGNG